jgi:hypothetical protein
LGNVLVQALALRQLPSLASAREVVAASVEPTRYMPRDTDHWDRWAHRLSEITGRET